MPLSTAEQQQATIKIIKQPQQLRHTSGILGPGGQGIALTTLTAWVPVASGELQHLVDQLTVADWLADAALTDGQLTGQLTERVLPLTCPLRA